jgi:hypothetical protein
MPTDTVIENSWWNSGVFTTRNGRYLRNYKSLDRIYQPWMTVHKEIADYIAIGKGRFISQGEQANQKTRAAQKVINPAAPKALHVAGAGIHGGLSSPAKLWYQLRFGDEDMNKFKTYREWLDQCEKILFAAFKESLFYKTVHSVYEEIAGFCTGSMFMDEKIVKGRPNGFTFYGCTAGDYRFSVGSDNLTKQWYRKYRQMACSVVSDFGEDNISDKVKNLLRTNPYEWVDIVHVVEQNPDHDEDKVDSKPITSVYFEAKENDRRLSEKGYYEMPAVTPRWQALSNEAYGWGPGLDALGLSKAIQVQEIQKMMGGDLVARPPMGVPPSMRDRMLDLSPGAKNVWDQNEGKPERLVDIDLNGLTYYSNDIKENEARIKEMFFNDLFLSLTNAASEGYKNIPHILAMNEEKMLMVGPTIEGLEYELLDPIVTRGFNILMRQGKFPNPPDGLENAEYHIEYISVLAQAQKLINNQSLQAYLGTAERVAGVDEGTIIKTDWDKFLDEVGENVSLPAKILRSEDEVKDIRDAIAQKEAEAAELEKSQAETANIKMLSETQTKGGSNVLADVQDSVGG